MKKRLILLLITVLVLFSSSSFFASSGSLDVLLSPSVNDITRGTPFNYNVYLTNNTYENISAFRLKLCFDNKNLECKGINVGEETEKSQFKYNIEPGLITIIYLSADYPYVLSNERAAEMFSIKFTVLKSANPGQTFLDAKVDGMVNHDIESILLNSIKTESVNIIEDPVYSCTLSSLDLSEADIYPEFSAQITNYSAEVDSSVNSVEVYAKTADENAQLKVNRKSLGKIGSSTDINITVTSADKKSKLVYHIKVKRNERNPEDPDPSSPSKKNTNSKISGSNKSTPSKGLGKNTISESLNTKSGKNSNRESPDLILKNNNMIAFIVGILAIVCPIGGYFMYKYKFNPATKNKKY